MNPRLKLFLFIMSFFIIVGLGLLIKIVWFPAHVAIQSINMPYDIANQTLTGENAIYNYEWFIRQEEGIRALYSKEARAKEEVVAFEEFYPDKDKWTKFDKDEYARLRANVTGVSNILDERIAEYNARSSMVNRNIFKDNLPVNISRAFYTGMNLISGGN